MALAGGFMRASSYPPEHRSNRPFPLSRYRTLSFTRSTGGGRGPADFRTTLLQRKRAARSTGRVCSTCFGFCTLETWEVRNLLRPPCAGQQAPQWLDPLDSLGPFRNCGKVSFRRSDAIFESLIVDLNQF